MRGTWRRMRSTKRRVGDSDSNGEGARPVAEKMYRVEGFCPDNETLARRLQAGDVHAAALLLSQNEDYLTRLASELCANYDVSSLIEDLKQEGAVALIDAAGRFDAESGAKLLTFSTPAIRSAMLDHLAEASLSVCLPTNRYHRLRRVAYLVTTQESSASEEDLCRSICDEMGVSRKVARELMEEYRGLFRFASLDDDAFTVSHGGDPAPAYDRYMRKKLLRKLMDELLKPRERNVIIYHLGLERAEGMTFEELAIRLNFNDPSAAQKAYERAIEKLRRHRDEGDLGVWVRAAEALREAEYAMR